MIYLKYIVSAICSLIFTLIAYLFAPIIVLFVREDNTLVLSWLGTPDAQYIGADFWIAQHPNYSDYQLAVTWMWRNPAQGFDQLLKANIANQTPVKVYGNPDISDGVYGTPIGGWFFITGGGVFQFSAIIPTRFCCIDIGLGWRLDPIAKKYETKTLGALIATPMRFFRLNSR